VTCLATRPHWLLASTIPFSRSRCPTRWTAPRRVVGSPTSVEPTLTSHPYVSLREASVSTRHGSTRADWRSYGPNPGSASRRAAILPGSRSHAAGAARARPLLNDPTRGPVPRPTGTSAPPG
jgi:hypothetical protein